MRCYPQVAKIEKLIKGCTGDADVTRDGCANENDSIRPECYLELYDLKELESPLLTRQQGDIEGL